MYRMQISVRVFNNNKHVFANSEMAAPDSEIITDSPVEVESDESISSTLYVTRSCAISDQQKTNMRLTEL